MEELEEEYEDDAEVDRVRYVAADEVDFSSSEDEEEDIEDIGEKLAQPSTSRGATKKSKRGRRQIVYDDEETEALRSRAEAQSMRQTISRF